MAMLAGCDDTPGSGAQGTVVVLLEAEESIAEGLVPGEELENTVDGWTVTFDKYLVAIGPVHLAQGTAREVESEDVRVVDLAKLGPAGVELTRFSGVDTGTWDRFTYDTPHAADAVPDDDVSMDDYDAMVDGDWTYLIEGEASDGTNTVAFRFGVPAETTYGPCEAEEGSPGVTVVEMGQTTVSVTIHGDHLFFNGFPSGAEIVERRAQWLWDADQLGNADGMVDADELKGISGSDLATLFPLTGDVQYFLAGSPVPIEDAWDFVRGQMHTVGHFQGEGECPWTVDGKTGGHDHGDEDEHDHGDEDDHDHD
ncbi:MAG: hypothetical protein KC416_05420 [Myxococcales bacterium]|nr:hypothetical protein [Myxococcales bacterium]